MNTLMLFASFSIAYSDPLNSYNEFLHLPPPYLQSYEEFMDASKYLNQQLSYDSRSNYKEFGVIVTTVAELAHSIRPQNPPQRYMPQQILQQNLLRTSKQHQYFINETRRLFIDAAYKIQPISRFIDDLRNYDNKVDTESCNKAVYRYITKKKYFQPIGELVLQLGRVSSDINGYSDTIVKLLREKQLKQFLKHHIDDPHVRHLMKEFYKTYNLVQNTSRLLI